MWEGEGVMLVQGWRGGQWVHVYVNITQSLAVVPHLQYF